jgi:hypothetical protein
MQNAQIDENAFHVLCCDIQENIDARKSPILAVDYRSYEIVASLFGLELTPSELNDFLKHEGRFRELFAIYKNGQYYPLILVNGRMPDGTASDIKNEDCFIPGRGGRSFLNAIANTLTLECRPDTESILSLGFKNPYVEISRGMINDSTRNNCRICDESELFTSAMYRNPKTHSSGLTLEGLYSEIYAGVDDKPNKRIFKDKLQSFLPSECNTTNDYIDFDGELFYVNTRAIKSFKGYFTKIKAGKPKK